MIWEHEESTGGGPPPRPSKAEMVALVTRKVDQAFPGAPRWARALHNASTFMCMAQEHFGWRIILQAGSMRWRRVPHHEDDGVSPTHFSYEWGGMDHGQAFLLAHATGRLPEIHVWAADPEANEVIDLSTGALPEACNKLLGMDWRTPRPPPYLWAGPATWPEDAIYQVDEQATLFAHLAAADLWAQVVDNVVRRSR